MTTSGRRQQTLLSAAQIQTLQAALSGRKLALCFGAGVDSTAMMVALHVAGLRPDIVSFANTLGEKPSTMDHLGRMDEVLASWGWPAIAVCTKRTLASTGYHSLFDNCWKNETLPSLAFGSGGCSIKWKQDPQDYFILGAKRGPNACPPHPVWLAAQACGERIVKLIGYDAGPADLRRIKKAPRADAHFDYAYPLQLLGWTRSDCIAAIEAVLGPDYVPIKSAYFFCPASRPWELFWLAAYHPDLLEQSLQLERRALTGRHSRFDAAEWGASWEEIVRTADRFPSSATSVGLGRSFAWNQWARIQGVVDDAYRVRRADAPRFIAMAAQLRQADNALDARTTFRLMR
ncbi:hypothetical protein CSQ89_07850 [Chitinimonas sp. BJB300]|nr:hypothetical protein CSQ89_07850 [Chitinimonas sp. BJB300]TSJ84956.1 hypothetical protein FG002_018335 [Chitinimonas sp. BJB300]